MYFGRPTVSLDRLTGGSDGVQEDPGREGVPSSSVPVPVSPEVTESGETTSRDFEMNCCRFSGDRPRVRVPVGWTFPPTLLYVVVLTPDYDSSFPTSNVKDGVTNNFTTN